MSLKPPDRNRRRWPCLHGGFARHESSIASVALPQIAARTDDDRRHIFGLVVAVGMACVGRASRYPHRDDGRDRRRHVDDAFQGIGIGSQAAGIEIGGELDGRHHKADPQACRAQFSEIYPLQNISDRRCPLVGRAGEMIE
jgi:hypothetical protein